MSVEIDGYEDLVDIGGGGFSRVYRARDLKHDRTVAIKVLDTRAASDSELRAFSRELKAMGGIGDHPHTVTVLESGFTATNRPFLVMPFFEAGTFSDQMKKSGRQPVTDVLDLGIKIASALETVHQLGYLHRDVKPENIFVGEFGGHALGDFGISSITDGSSGTRTVGVALTPAHAAPEVWEDEKPTALTDIYSLGSTLYNLLAARPPFVADSHAALLRKVLSEDPPGLERNDVPTELSQLITEMLSKSPDDRPSSALEVATSLREIQLDQAYPATPITVRGWTPDGHAAPASAPIEADRSARSFAGANETIIRDNARTQVPEETESVARAEISAETPSSAAAPDVSDTESTVIRSPLQRAKPADPAGPEATPTPDAESFEEPAGGRGLAMLVAVVAALVIGGAAVTLLTGGTSGGEQDDDPADNAVQEIDPDDVGPILIAGDPEDFRIEPTGDQLFARWEGTTNPNILYEVMTNGIEQIAETTETEINLEDAGLLLDGEASCVSVRVTTLDPARVGEWVGPECSDG